MVKEMRGTTMSSTMVTHQYCRGDRGSLGHLGRRRLPRNFRYLNFLA